MSDKTEQATAYKLQKEKELGRVNKSSDLICALFLLVLLAISYFLWPSWLVHIKSLLTHLLYLINQFAFSVDTITQLHQRLLTDLLALWLPFALVGMLAIILATIAQTGLVWSGKPLIPTMQRLSPTSGLKRLCSTKLVIEAGKNSVKLGAAIVLLTISIEHEIGTLVHVMTLNPSQLPNLVMNLLVKITLQLLALLLLLAIIDKQYSRWRFAKDNRMSKQEVKDEYRQREGDPKIKAKIKQLQQQLRQKTASLEHVKTADVVITNPTHLAIALKYERGLMPAPKVVCKAHGDLVACVKSLAIRHHVPIIEHKPFARALFTHVALNHWIKPEHFPIAAMIFRDIFQQKGVPA